MLALGLLLALLLASRLLALPLTIWEQDEAYLAMAAERFDPARSCPQPPWFPLWVGLGHLGHLAGLPAARTLQLLSLASSVASLVPLVALWRRVTGRFEAYLAAVLFLATPVAWLCAGRALSETPATAALASMCALWCDPRRDSRRLAAGSLAAGAVFLIRPQLLPAVVLPALLLLVATRGARQRALVVAPGVTASLLGFALMLVAGGGWRPFLDSLRLHSTLHFGQLGEVSYALGSSGLARALLHPGAAAAWIVLTAIGAISMVRRQPGLDQPGPVILAALGGALLSVYGVANPQHARYFIPILALSAGPVVAALAVLAGRAAVAAVLAAVAAFTWQVAPGLATYRSQPSPPLAALRLAAQWQRESGAMIVVDRRLNAFVQYESSLGTRRLRSVYDYEAQLGTAGLAEQAPLIVVYDHNNPLALLPATTVERVAWPASAVRRLSPDRFVEITVAVTTGATSLR